MTLSELLVYDDIVIQTHDNPDPDALASAFGLYLFFKEKGKAVRIVYSGRNRITKPNLLMMIQECGIPIEYAHPETFEKPGILITVDCQYGEGNVTRLNADKVAIIDHHQGLGQADYLEIRSYLGSCSTLVWSMLNKEGFEFSENIALGTAFYYGLMTDTSGFLEVSHPLDRDLMDTVNYSKSLIKIFTNCNISLKELEIAGQALIHYEFDEANHTAMIYSKPCDPNILGFINDLALQVDEIFVSIVYNELNSGFKLSVRSCIKEVRADELADYLTERIGSGGGHNEKAGGYIDREMFKMEYPDVEFDEYLRERVARYYSTCEIIYAKDYTINLEGMIEYRKKNLNVGFIDPISILPEGTKITIRTLEGDMDLEVDNDFYILIGIKGEVWPIRKSKFENKYEIVEEKYEFEGEYEPTIHITKDGKVLNLIQYAKTCRDTGKLHVFARPLERTVKIFPNWDPDKYWLGKAGDFILCRADDHKDVYVCKRDIFFKTYEEVVQ